MSHFSEETICALATPPGAAGLGVIRLSGPEAFAIADAATRRPHNVPCRDRQGHTLHRAVVTDADGWTLDDVLLAIFHAPRSYTGEDVVEVSAHGGPIPLRQVLGRLLVCGARLARPGEFTQRAFLNGKMDLAQAEAVADIIAARTDEAHALARRQGEGQLSRNVGRVRVVLLGILARIEASIDFPEETGELDTDLCLQDLAAALAGLQTLLDTAERGILIRDGLTLVLAGRPNVGKSSLMNALLRTPRAIVTPIPGTTRDVIEESFNLGGIPLRLRDTAGLRDTDDLVEQIGVARTRETLDQADFTLLVLDASVGETGEDAALRASLAARPHLVVWNKWDLVPSNAPAWEEGTTKTVKISAATGWNLETLEQALTQALGERTHTGSDGQEAVVTHARHRRALEAARDSLGSAQSALGLLPADFVSIDVRGALSALGEITGETADSDIITEIFSRFCIGK